MVCIFVFFFETRIIGVSDKYDFYCITFELHKKSVEGSKLFLLFTREKISSCLEFQGSTLYFIFPKQKKIATVGAQKLFHKKNTPYLLKLLSWKYFQFSFEVKSNKNKLCITSKALNKTLNEINQHPVFFLRFEVVIERYSYKMERERESEKKNKYTEIQGKSEREERKKQRERV